MADTFIEYRDLYKSFGDKRVLRGINLTIRRGETVVILGGSGIGKSVCFAYFIAIIACHNGLTARGGADGVGRATTNTVVMASIAILISDFFLTKLFLLF